MSDDDPMSPLTAVPESLQLLDAYWRAANYLAVGQIYLLDNPLLTEPLQPTHIKPRLLGHWGTTPGQNFIYAHLNRVITALDLDMIYLSGPGHGGPAVVANVYLEGTYSEVYPAITQDRAGLAALFRQFSFPGGIPSHVAPETPGSIHEGGELGYSLSHAFGAVFDNPNLIAACVIGDGEAETGPLATAWHSNMFLNPATDGAVLPILHLNGYKIANPTVLARIPRSQLAELLRGYGWNPHFVEGDDPAQMHVEMARTLDTVVHSIRDLQAAARTGGSRSRPAWPMIVLATPKGWTGPAIVDGHRIEGTFRAHQIPLTAPRTNPEHLSTARGRGCAAIGPRSCSTTRVVFVRRSRRSRRQGRDAWGRIRTPTEDSSCADLVMPDFRTYGVSVGEPGATDAEDTRVLGRWLRDVVTLNAEQRNFRLFGPDETVSNRLDAVFEATSRQWMGEQTADDEWLAPDGRVMEMLSEHQCQGWLEGYLLTGRHGLFNTYEAFVHVVDSMFNQHAKWLQTTRTMAWRQPLASLNYLLSSHVWRQDHNGFTHQDPGFIDVALNKAPEVVRVYLPPDANCLLSVMDHCLRSRHYVNIVVAGKHPAPQWLDMAAAARHCAAGIGRWPWASSDDDGEPDLVMVAAGDVPTLETLAAVTLLKTAIPELKIRMVNVVDLMRLQPETEHPHGLSDEAIRRPLHARQAGDLRVSRLSLADSSPDVSPHQSSEYPRAWLQGARDHHDAF